MKKFFLILLTLFLILPVVVCTALAEEVTTPLNPSDVSWLDAYIDYVIVGICLVVGLLIKHCTPLNNKYIPLIVAVVGLLVAVWKHWSEGITPIVLLGGLFSGLASTGFHQVFKQLFFADGE